jgi:hypothetical protein
MAGNITTENLANNAQDSEPLVPIVTLAPLGQYASDPDSHRSDFVATIQASANPVSFAEDVFEDSANSVANDDTALQEEIFLDMLEEARRSWMAVNCHLREYSAKLQTHRPPSTRSATLIVDHCSDLMHRVVQLHLYARDGNVPVLFEYDNPRRIHRQTFNTAHNVQMSFEQIQERLQTTFDEGRRYFHDDSGQSDLTEAEEGARESAFREVIGCTSGVGTRSAIASLQYAATQPQGSSENHDLVPTTELEFLPVPDLLMSLQFSRRGLAQIGSGGH